MEIRVEGVKNVVALLAPEGVGRAWIAGARDAGRRAREHVKTEAALHQRYTGRMARKPRYTIRPKNVEASGNGRAMLSAYALVDPGLNTPESYILAYGHRSRRFPNVNAIAAWAARRGFVEGTSRNLATNRMRYGEGGRKGAIQRALGIGNIAFLMAKAIQKRGFNLQGRGDKTDNYWWRATGGQLPGQVRDDVEKHLVEFWG